MHSNLGLFIHKLICLSIYILVDFCSKMKNQSAGSVASNQSPILEDAEDSKNVRKRKRRAPKKKHIKDQKFVIHPVDLYATLSELHRARKHSTTIALDDCKSEEDIRVTLMENLPQLRGIR